MVLVPATHTYDKFCWKCQNSQCQKYQTTLSLRNNSFFSGFKCSLRVIMKVCVYWVADLQQYQVFKLVDLIGKLLILFGTESFYKSKTFLNVILSDWVVLFRLCHLDETMINFKAKSHRGRSTHRIGLLRSSTFQRNHQSDFVQWCQIEVHLYCCRSFMNTFYQTRQFIQMIGRHIGTLEQTEFTNTVLLYISLILFVRSRYIHQEH
jgi:hypothetical protein